ncbi:MAG: hypothetical protein ABTQ31_12875 [Rhizobiaceae bacterium]
MADKVTIVNWALAELGLAPRFTIDDATPLGGTVDIFWPRAIGRAFGLHDWTFCRQTFQLTRQEAVPVTGYRYGFSLPGADARIGPPQKVLSDPRSQRPIRDMRIEGQTLFCDEDRAFAVCKVPVDPGTWDLQWADCFGVLLAAFLAVPLLQDADMAAEKEVKAVGTPQQGGAGGVFGRLIAQDRAAAPVGSNLYADDPLTAAHGGAPWYGRY